VRQSFDPGAEIVLAHVIEPPDRPRFAQDKLPPEEVFESSAREYASRRMHEIFSYLSGEPLRTEIRVGRPYEQMTRLAQELRAGLIVIGPHGDRPHTSKFLGSTAERIVRASPVPVLVATTPRDGAPRRLLVPVDDTEVTGAVLDSARALAARFDAEITLLHVWSNAVYSHVASMSHAHAKSDAAAEAEIDQELIDTARHWLKDLARHGVDDQQITTLVTYGKAGDAVISVASEVQADLIVLGRKSTHVLAPALLGSTIGTVLHDARCPVLVVTGDARVT
jgi:nucleotide-binding universal stress UspA family protein